MSILCIDKRLKIEFGRYNNTGNLDDIQWLDNIIGTLPFLVLCLKRPIRAAPIVGGLAVFFEF